MAICVLKIFHHNNIYIYLEMEEFWHNKKSIFQKEILKLNNFIWFYPQNWRETDVGKIIKKFHFNPPKFSPVAQKKYFKILKANGRIKKIKIDFFFKCSKYKGNVIVVVLVVRLRHSLYLILTAPQMFLSLCFYFSYILFSRLFRYSFDISLTLFIGK